MKGDIDIERLLTATEVINRTQANIHERDGQMWWSERKRGGGE